MEPEYKQTLEWQALSRIWKAIPADKRQSLMEDFRLLTDWVKKDMELSRPKPEEDPQPETGFLNGVSPRIKMLVLKRLTAGQGNLYDQCMEIARSGGDETAMWKKALAADATLADSEKDVRELLRVCMGRIY